MGRWKLLSKMCKDYEKHKEQLFSHDTYKSNMNSIVVLGSHASTTFDIIFLRTGMNRLE